MKIKFLFFIIILFFSFNLISFSEGETKELIDTDHYYKGKVVRIKSVEDVSKEETDIIKILEVIVLMKSGPDKGKKIILTHPVLRNKVANVYIKKGDNVVLLLTSDMGLENYYIIDHDKIGKAIFLLLLFFGLVILFAKIKGVKAIVALLTLVVLIFYFFIPLIVKGFPPIILAIIVSALASLVTIYLITGLNRKGTIAVFGTVGGIIFSGILSILYVNIMKLSGFSSSDALYSSYLFEQINIKEVVSAGIILGSLGAIMDVAVSVSSSMNEIVKANPTLKMMELFKAGITIGSDIIGTMVNTLILAYIGSSLIMILLFVMQKSDFPLIRILNSEFIITEFTRAICGSIGILISIPVTAYVGAKMYKKSGGVGDEVE